MHKIFPVLFFLSVFAQVGLAAEADSALPPASKSTKSKPPKQSKSTHAKSSPAGKPAKSKPPRKSKPAEPTPPPTSKVVELCAAASEDHVLSKGLLEDHGIATGGFENLPADVKCFLENAASCEHFAGEEPYDKEREEFIHEALKRYCSAARNQLQPLKQKYQSRMDVQRILAVCEKGSQAVCAD